MPTPNEGIVAASGLVTVVVAAYTAFTGSRSKGKDQHLAQATSSYDQIQEDLKDKREEIAALRAELKAERDRADGLHEERMRNQDDRHERKSLLRAYEIRCRERGVPCDDLAVRAAALEVGP